MSRQSSHVARNIMPAGTFAPQQPLQKMAGIDLYVLAAFIKEAQALQAGEDEPVDYAVTKAVVMRKLGMVKESGGGFMLADHLNEVAGLGTLAIPSLRKKFKSNQENPEKMEKIEKSEPNYEVAGLGMLAAPYAHRLAERGSKTYANTAKRIGGFVSKHAPRIAQSFVEHH